MRHVVRSGKALAPAQLAHSVHVEVAGLKPRREYFYRFRAGGEHSPVGRTMTTPRPGQHVTELRFAFASCQKWDDGYYSAYRRMAEEDLDLVIHLGDYIYEYGIGPTGGFRNVPVPDRFASETMNLGRYRLQHALYRTDPDLQEAHRLFPWVVTWDDHEVENDYAGVDAEGPPFGRRLHSPSGRRLPGVLRAPAIEAGLAAQRDRDAALPLHHLRRPCRVQRPGHPSVPQCSTVRSWRAAAVPGRARPRDDHDRAAHRSAGCWRDWPRRRRGGT